MILTCGWVRIDVRRVDLGRCWAADKGTEGAQSRDIRLVDPSHQQFWIGLCNRDCGRSHCVEHCLPARALRVPYDLRRARILSRLEAEIQFKLKQTHLLKAVLPLLSRLSSSCYRSRAHLQIWPFADRQPRCGREILDILVAVVMFCLRPLAFLALAAASPIDIADTRRELVDEDCSTICGEGIIMGLPDNPVNIGSDFQGLKTCVGVDLWLAQKDDIVCGLMDLWLEFINFAAYCGCEGTTVPNLCESCSDGGVIADPDRVVTSSLLGTTYTCAEGAELVSYLKSTLACTLFLPTFDDACCGPATPSASPPIGSTTSRPVAAPVAIPPIAAPVTAPSESPPTTPSIPPPVAAPVTSAPIAAPFMAPSATPPTTPSIPPPVAAPVTVPSPPASGSTLRHGRALCIQMFVLAGAWIMFC